MSYYHYSENDELKSTKGRKKGTKNIKNYITSDKFAADDAYKCKKRPGLRMRIN